MSNELRKLIADYKTGKQAWEETHKMFCKISKRKDLQRQIKRTGKKSFNVTHINRALKKFLAVNPEYGKYSGSGKVSAQPIGNGNMTPVNNESSNSGSVSGNGNMTPVNKESSNSGSVYGSGANETISGNGFANGSGSGLSEFADHFSGSGGITIEFNYDQLEKKNYDGDVNFDRKEDKTSNGLPVYVNPPAPPAKKQYPKEDIIVRIKNRLADISNKRSILQGQIEKIGTKNDVKSITERKPLLDTIKALGDEYDRLFNAKEKYFSDDVMPEESIFRNEDEPKQISVVEAVGMRNNIRSQISRAKTKSKKLTGEELTENELKIKNLSEEIDRLQAIIDNANKTK